MTDVSAAIDRIASVAEARGGLKRLARASGVPYTTLADWKGKNWRPKGVEVLERLSEAADRIANEDQASATGQTGAAA